MGKQLYKVELTGWVVKDEEDSDVMDWSIEAITNDMIGFEVQTTLVDSSGINPGQTTTSTVQSTVQITTTDTMNETGAMDIELDTKGMSL